MFCLTMDADLHDLFDKVAMEIIPNLKNLKSVFHPMMWFVCYMLRNEILINSAM